MGSQPSMPAQATPDQEAAANIKEMQAKAALDAQTAAQKAADDAAQHTKDIGHTQDLTNNAIAAARQYGSNQLSAKGLDPTNDQYGIMKLFNNSLDLARQSVPEVSSSVGSYFGPNLFDTAYDTARSQQRTNLNRQLDQFAGTGFERNMFADTSDDDILNSILGKQKSDAQLAIDAAHSRGTINDFGYNAAGSDLNDMFNASMSKANDIGAGVLSADQKQLTDRAGQYRTQAQNYDFGDTFDPNNAKTDLTGLSDSLHGRLNGDILNAIGGTNFFDTSKLLATAGNRSGLVNAAATNPLAAPGSPDDPTKKVAATTGTTGVF